jgi:CBS domain-containing protein
MDDRLDQPVERIMQTDYVSVAAGDHLDLVDDVMNLGRIRHMPVLDGQKLVGVVSQRDLLSASLSKVLDFDAAERRTFMRSIEVSEVMTASPVTVRPSTSLREAARLVLTHRIGCLPVVGEDDRMVGLVTETDLLRGVYD